MKPKQFKKLTERKYILDLGPVTIKRTFKQDTPWYPQIQKLQNKINRDLDKLEKKIIINRTKQKKDMIIELIRKRKTK